MTVSLAKWQRVFGDKFQRPQKAATEAVIAKSAASLPVQCENTEQHLPDLGISTTINPRYRFRIEGRVLKSAHMGAYYLKNRGNKVLRGRQIRFQIAECNIPGPYQIFWKVKNCGPEALKRDCIRGQITAGERVWRIDETTNFVGPHFVDCYIVKNGICVARDRQEVIII